MNLQLCVFSKHLSWLSMAEAAKVAREAGLDGIDLAVRPGGHVEPESVERDLPEAVEAITAAGLRCPMIVTAITGADEPHTESIIRTAASCGIRYYRLGYLSYGPSIDDSLAAHGRSLTALAELNEKYRIHGAYQNHAGTRVGGPVWDIWELVRGLDSRWIGCQYDVRHAVIEGATSWTIGMRLLADHIRCIALKDAKWSEPAKGTFSAENTPIGEGMVDWNAFASLLPTTAFEGAASVHFEYPLPDEHASDPRRIAGVVSAMAADVARLRTIIAR